LFRFFVAGFFGFVFIVKTKTPLELLHESRRRQANSSTIYFSKRFEEGIGEIGTDVAHVVADLDNGINGKVELFDNDIGQGHSVSLLIALATASFYELPAVNNITTNRTKVCATH